jgi:LytS/YehU family sensor histidine kinase
MKKQFLDYLIGNLNSISRTSAMENAPQTKKLVNMLISSIRYKTGRENQIVKLREEIKAAKNLIDTYKLRFGDVINSSLDIDESCNEIFIPHYTIMTFIENIFYHAFENVEDEWKLKISCNYLGSQVRITITDKGIGFDSHKYTKYDFGTEDSEEYGTIKSTLARLRRYYNSDIAAIKSKAYFGTEVIINIPAAGGEDELND